MIPLSDLCRDITMKLPDPLWALSEHERYRVGRATKDFARWHDEEAGGERFYLFGALDVPLAHTSGEVFSWGLWVEVEPAFHNRYYEAFQTPEAEGLVTEGFIANDVPDYPDALGARVRLTCHAGRRPTIEPLEGTLAEDYAKGLSETRHRALDAALFGDEDEEAEDDTMTEA